MVEIYEDVTVQHARPHWTKVKCDVCDIESTKRFDSGFYTINLSPEYSTCVVRASVCGDACLIAFSKDPHKYLKHEELKVYW